VERQSDNSAVKSELLLLLDLQMAIARYTFVNSFSARALCSCKNLLGTNLYAQVGDTY
jgi:hypothetical protein